jgi:hypothetical protein
MTAMHGSCEAPAEAALPSAQPGRFLFTKQRALPTRTCAAYASFT